MEMNKNEQWWTGKKTKCYGGASTAEGELGLHKHCSAATAASAAATAPTTDTATAAYTSTALHAFLDPYSTQNTDSDEIHIVS